MLILGIILDFHHIFFIGIKSLIEHTTHMLASVVGSYAPGTICLCLFKPQVQLSTVVTDAGYSTWDICLDAGNQNASPHANKAGSSPTEQFPQL